jgi:hypothetical protein
MAILAASTMNPAVTLKQGSKEIVLTRSTLQFAFRLQQAVGSASLHLFLRTYMAAAYAVLGILFATKIIALQSYLVSRFVAIKTAPILSSANARFWMLPKVRRFRKNLEIELFVFLFGPAIHLFLWVFWPGWLVIAATLWGLGLWAR